jgi:hypothetical protein
VLAAPANVQGKRPGRLSVTFIYKAFTHTHGNWRYADSPSAYLLSFSR